MVKQLEGIVTMDVRFSFFGKVGRAAQLSRQAQKGTQDVKKLHELPREELERIFNAAPFVASLGIRLVTVGPGICETELDVELRHLQQDGIVHAGVQATVADHTDGGAAATLIEPGHIVLTAEF